MNSHSLDFAAALRAAGFEWIPDRGWCRRIERYLLPLTEQEYVVNEQGGRLWPGEAREVYAEFHADLAGWLKLAEKDAIAERPELNRWRRWLETYALPREECVS
jgi:hypothetical protein